MFLKKLGKFLEKLGKFLKKLGKFLEKLGKFFKNISTFSCRSRLNHPPQSDHSFFSLHPYITVKTHCLSNG